MKTKINIQDEANSIPFQGSENLKAEGSQIKLSVKSKTMLADMQTPVGIYLKVRDLYTNSVLLESSDYHGLTILLY